MWIWFIPLLLAALVLHESGHYFVARLFGIKIDEVGFGFPPRIARWGKFSLNLFPVGAFVSPNNEDFNSRSARVRACVFLAGVGFNFLGGFIGIVAALTDRLGLIGAFQTTGFLPWKIVVGLPVALIGPETWQTGFADTAMITGEMIRLHGLAGICLMWGAINWSFAIGNILPIPLLDGSHLWLLVVEKIRKGKPLPSVFQKAWAIAGVSAIAGITGGVMWNDGVKILRIIF